MAANANIIINGIKIPDYGMGLTRNDESFMKFEICK
jgi:hypothetical protein